MDDAHVLPNDLAECHQLLLAAFRQAFELERVEEQARDLSAEARREVRDREATPVLYRIGIHLEELKKRVLPKSALAKAVWYASNQWQALCRYTEDGRLSIDNNISE